ncbi:SusC/RagA family TonB-linked outer membrane protein [Pedobacter sp. MW01-1-1]|uniref:SusC/RagA family TonB-linked outer membrane protein n=1 Tax=Pedobacter sp. MW01-1-1 TaxID=3383027 RepID=UPI003FED5F71
MNRIIYFRFIMVLALLSFNTAFAQSIISGKVSDDSGKPLPGASVLIEGTKIGTITDNNGQYSLKVTDTKKNLIVSFIGLQSQTIAVNGRTTINVSLKESSNYLDEAVVIGYGTVKRSDLTGSVAQVKTQLVEQRAVNSPEELLQGTTPGVQITRTGGAPGSNVDVTIRGGNSLNGSNQPLYIVDGFEMNSSDSFYSQSEPSGSTPAPSGLAMINPNDIESIDVLKDASATAIYGARGANGVIIITTKKGKAGKAIIQVDYGGTVSALPQKIGVLDSKQWVQLYDEAAVNDGRATIYGNPADLASYDKYTNNVNWQDEIYRTAKGHDLNLAVRGGTDAFKYSFAGNYNLNEGLITKSDQEKISIRSNIDVKATSFLNVGMNGYFANTKSNLVPYSNNGYNGFFSPVMMAVQYRAYDLAWDDDLNTNSGDFVNDGTAPYNPLTQIVNTTDEMRLNYAQSNFYANLQLTSWLKFKSTFGFNYSDGLRNSFWGVGTQQGDLQNNIVSRAQTNNFDYINENTLNFEKTFNGLHAISAVVGQSSHRWIRKTFLARASGFDITSLGYESFQGATVVEVPETTHTEWGLSSFYGRFNYTYNNRYLFTFTGRYDGSSRFAPGNKWSFFPSAAFAWKISEENFLKNSKAVSNLKLRTSYGTSGSQAIGVLSTIATLQRGYRYPVSNTFLPGVSSSTYLFNEDLRWETTVQGDIGLDAGFFDNRLNVTLDFYQKTTKDLLLDKNFPISSGFTTTTVNGGKVRNRGWELGINGDAIRKKDVKWNIGLSLSQNKSKILDLDGADYLYGEAIANIQGGYPNISYLNGTVGQFYGYKTNGIYQTAAEVVNAPTKGGIAPKAGDINYVDINSDGVINENDKVIIGNPQPTLLYGLTTSFDYKGLNINMVFNGSIGNDVLNLNNVVWEGMNIWDGRYNQTQRAYEGRWVPGSTDAMYPRASLTTVRQDFLDRYVENGAFFRMQNVSVSYTWKPKNMKVLNSIRPFVSASNLFVITSYSGYDPEIRGKNTALSPGIDLGSYPLPRTFKFGVSVILN